MRKLTLNLDDLQVDSFATDLERASRDGTVRGYFTNPCVITVRTDGATCPYTCDDGTCVGSCQGTSCYLPACNTCESCPGGPCQAYETNPCTV
ncbi:MAG TPA: pinensin family lanthipeptide [Longimicrobium sp.]|nr:pinensin family lanthipeptide [Longimicrobium sp.]